MGIVQEMWIASQAERFRVHDWGLMPVLRGGKRFEGVVWEEHSQSLPPPPSTPPLQVPHQVRRPKRLEPVAAYAQSPISPVQVSQPPAWMTIQLGLVLLAASPGAATS